MKLFGETSIYFGANIINAAIPFLLLPILTRVLTPAEYGTVAIFLVMVGLFSSVTGLSVHGAVGVRYFQLSEDDFSDYVSSCVGILILSTVLTLLILIMFQDWVVELSGLSIDWLIIAVLTSGAQFLINIRLSIWQVSGCAWKYGGLQISRSILDAFFSLVLLFGFGMAWQGRLLGIFNSVVLISTIGAFWLYKDGFLRKPKIWIEHAYNALNFGLPLIPHAVGGMLIVVTDRVLINKILGIESVGIYTVAIQAGMVIGLVVESFNKAYAPWLYKRLESNSEIANRKIVRFTYAYFIIIIFFGVIYGLAAPKILSLLVGDEFLAAGELIIYTSLGFALSGCYYMVTNYIFFSNKNGYLAILSFFAATLNIPITYFLLITQGIVGAAMAYFFISLLIFLCTWLIASRTHKMPWFSWLQSERN